MFYKILMTTSLLASLIYANSFDISKLSPQELQKLSQLKNSSTMMNTNKNIAGIDDQNLNIVNDINVNTTELPKEKKLENKLNPFVYMNKKALVEDIHSKQNIKGNAYKKFGASFFENKNLINQNSSLIPDNYIINIADVISIWIYGLENKNHTLEVDKKGNINIPSVGPIYVLGSKYKQINDFLSDKLEKIYQNSKIYVTLEKTTPIQVVVSGEVNSPGVYNLPSYSTIKEVLLAANGISKSGSYRTIKLIRAKKLVKIFDIYDLLQKGSNGYLDNIIKNGDNIIVGRITKEVLIKGEVHRSALYELKENEKLDSLIQYANGLQATANKHNIQVKSYIKNSSIQVKDIDYSVSKKYSLLNGDVVTVFPINKYKSNSVYLYGNVVENGVKGYYKDMTLYNLFQVMIEKNSINGVFLENTNMNYSLIKRTDKTTLEKRIITFSLEDILSKKEDIKLEQNDEIFVFNKAEFKENAYVYVKGSVVKNSDKYQYFKGMTLEDIYSITEFKSEIILDGNRVPIVEFNKVKIIRLNSDKTKVYMLDLSSSSKFVIEPFDTVEFYNKFDIVKDSYATINGEVNFPGEFKINKGSNINDLIEIAGGLTEKVYFDMCEIVRYDVKDGMRVETIFTKSLTQAMKENFTINNYDKITIFKIPNWEETRTIKISGEVKFPGTYTVHKGNKISDIIKRAGGYTDNAFIEGSFFSRNSVKLQQKTRLEESIIKLKQNLTYLATSPMGKGESVESRKLLIERIENTIDGMKDVEPEGRISVRFSYNLDKFENSPFNITLEDKDSIYIPTINNTITVIGEVLNQNTFVYNPDKTTDDYLELAGGLTPKAEDDNIYIVHANGEASTVNGSSFLFSSGTDIRQGDTIIVPLKIELESNMQVAKDISSILYQFAVTAASLSVVGVL